MSELDRISLNERIRQAGPMVHRSSMSPARLDLSDSNVKPNGLTPLEVSIEEPDDGKKSSSSALRQSPNLSYFDMQRLSTRMPHIDDAALEDIESTYQKIYVTNADRLPKREILQTIRRAVELRYKYFDEDLHQEYDPDLAEFSEKGWIDSYFSGAIPAASNHQFIMEFGVMKVWEGEDKSTCSKYSTISVDEFYNDLRELMRTVSHGPCKTFCFQRLGIVESRFKLHHLLNIELEMEQQKRVPHRDFYNVRKVDNHVHHSACMNQKHLLRFIKKKLRTDGDTKVIIRDEKVLTLNEVFASLRLTAYDLNSTVDALSMHAHQDSFHRFDKFNQKYNPLGLTRLREIFLKNDNYTNGRFLAEITQEVFADLESNKYQFAEYRLSIYGKKRKEWSKLASWVYDFKLASTNVRWMIQIPRLFRVYQENGLLKNFQEMLDNIFGPLFEVTVNPACDEKLHHFLKQVVAFDSVDDESIREQASLSKPVSPDGWNIQENPPYNMWAFYIYSNLTVLNKLRKSRGLNTFAYRPHAGEAGDIDHLASAFLLSKSIAHGLMLRKSPVLQYLFYLTQIGVSMSPLSNNLLFVQYERNPFPAYHFRGLNTTLSTDDPLMIHFTKEPLLEEYSVAAQVWKLSSVDMCEIARNSVLQSGFEDIFKRKWIGETYAVPGILGSCVHQTNVPSIRVKFRRDLREDECRMVWENDPAIKEMPFWFK